jgi:uncharacterized UPF0160 family protein
MNNTLIKRRTALSYSGDVPVLATHNGRFHADEVFGYVVMRLAFGLLKRGKDHLLIRTRKQDLLATADVVWDVGLILDDDTCRFDHHMSDVQGKPYRDDGVPLSSAGLLWRAFGEEVVRRIIPNIEEENVRQVWNEIDDHLFRHIDLHDNGIIQADEMSLLTLINNLNPTPNEMKNGGDGIEDKAFMEAAHVAQAALIRQLEVTYARFMSQELVLSAYAESKNPSILELPYHMPWEDVILNNDIPVLFVVYPNYDGRWIVHTVRKECGSYAMKVPLPQEWAGLQDVGLAQVSGVVDAIFVHPTCFIGGASTRQGAFLMAQKALECKPTPALGSSL